MSVQVGALSQGEAFQNSLFIAPRAFLGIAEKLRYKWSPILFSLESQQVIPTSYTFSTELVEREPTPSLLTAHAGLKYDHSFFQLGGR